MTPFKSRWETWQPGDEPPEVSGTPKKQTDKTDKRGGEGTSVGFVGSSAGKGQNFFREGEPSQEAPVTPHHVRVDIAPNVLQSFLVWVRQYHKLRLELSNELVLNTDPEKRYKCYRSGALGHRLPPGPLHGADLGDRPPTKQVRATTDTSS